MTTTNNWQQTAAQADAISAVLHKDAAVIDFNPDGSVEMMQDDKIGLGFLGHQEIRRATEIKWNETSQSWEIELLLYTGEGVLAGGQVVPQARGFSSYSMARAVEVKWLTLARAANVSPMCAEGLIYLMNARGALEPDSKYA